MVSMNWQELQNGSDIRGVALEGVEEEKVNLTPSIVNILGKSFTYWLTQRPSPPSKNLVIAIGRDSRLSGESLSQALAEGITELGATVYDFNIASTPAMFMSTILEDWQCDGAIMLTASHLPFNRNGLKFFTKQGGLDKQNITEILSLAEANNFDLSSEKGKIIERDFMSVYANLFVEKIRKSVNHPINFQQPLTGLHIVVDAGNGAGGFYAEKVLKPLGADISGSQFLEPDGNFPNHIPNPENQEAMASIVKALTENKADFGIIFDTDVDRSGAVDSQGKEINRNRLIALMSAIILQEYPHSTIVTDSITSEGLTKFIESELGGKHHRFKRGYKNVINEALRLNNEGIESHLAIETSGHGALKENYFLDDGAYLITKVLIKLAQLKLENKNLIDLINKLEEPLESAEIRIKITADNFKEYGNKIIEALAPFTEAQKSWKIVPKNHEGIRVSCNSEEEKGWFLLRLSLHDPVIPLNIESDVKGGIEQISAPLKQFLTQFNELEIPANW